MEENKLEEEEKLVIRYTENLLCAVNAEDIDPEIKISTVLNCGIALIVKGISLLPEDQKDYVASCIVQNTIENIKICVTDV